MDNAVLIENFESTPKSKNYATKALKHKIAPKL
jgi:hypothetical protein